MNYLETFDRPDVPMADRAALPSPGTRDFRDKGRRGGTCLFGLAACSVLALSLAFGAWHRYAQSHDVAVTSKQRLDFVPKLLGGDPWARKW